MSFNINEMRSQLTFGGARPTQFQVRFNNPANSVANIKVPFMCEAAKIPEAQLGVIQVPYFGRTVKHAGDRTYPEWTVTVINDEDFLIRNALEEWSNKINTFQGNVRGFSSAASQQYKTTATVTQFGKTGVPLREYTFDGIFPQAISSIDLNWGAVDQIERYSVVFQYDWWEVSGGITGRAGGA